MSLLMKWVKLIKKIHFWDLPAESAIQLNTGISDRKYFSKSKKNLNYNNIRFKNFIPFH